MGQPTFDNKSHDLAASGFGTRAIHAGHVPDGLTGAVIPPISLSTTFKQTAAGVHKVLSIFFSTCMAFVYTRFVFLTLVLYRRVLIILDLETPLATTLRMP
jgi:cystathionine beta-lyase/cystathionine gamma-synthase